LKSHEFIGWYFLIKKKNLKFPLKSIIPLLTCVVLFVLNILTKLIKNELIYEKYIPLTTNSTTTKNKNKDRQNKTISMFMCTSLP